MVKINKIKLVILTSLVLSGYSYSDIDLSNSFRGKVARGYSGIEVGANYSSFHSNKSSSSELIFDSKRAEIHNRIIENLKNTLNLDNRDRELLLSLDYNAFNSPKASSNTLSALLGISKETHSRLGIKGDYSLGKIDKVKTKDISGTVFYHSNLNKNKYTILGYVGNSKGKKEDINDFYYGIYGEYSHKLPTYWLGTLEYFEPSVYSNIHYQKYEEKNKNDKVLNNKLLNMTIGLKGDKDFEIDDFKISTIMKLGYNKEFLAKEKYKALSKEKDVDKIITEIGINGNYDDFIDVYGKYKFQKSLNTSNNSGVAEIGFKVKF